RVVVVAEQDEARLGAFHLGDQVHHVALAERRLRGEGEFLQRKARLFDFLLDVRACGCTGGGIRLAWSEGDDVLEVAVGAFPVERGLTGTGRRRAGGQEGEGERRHGQAEPAPNDDPISHRYSQDVYPSTTGGMRQGGVVKGLAAGERIASMESLTEPMQIS